MKERGGLDGTCLHEGWSEDQGCGQQPEKDNRIIKREMIYKGRSGWREAERVRNGGRDGEEDRGFSSFQNTQRQRAMIYNYI